MDLIVDMIIQSKVPLLLLYTPGLLLRRPQLSTCSVIAHRLYPFTDFTALSHRLTPSTIRQSQVILWVTMGKPVFLHNHTLQ